jgi:hypothetical protein
MSMHSYKMGEKKYKPLTVLKNGCFVEFLALLLRSDYQLRDSGLHQCVIVVFIILHNILFVEACSFFIFITMKGSKMFFFLNIVFPS